MYSNASSGQSKYAHPLVGPRPHGRYATGAATATTQPQVRPATWTDDAVSVRTAIPCPVAPDVKYTSPVWHRGGPIPLQNTVRQSRSVRHVATR